MALASPPPVLSFWGLASRSVFDQGEEAVLVELEETLFAEPFAERLDERGVFGGGGEGALDVRAAGAGETFAEGLLFEGLDVVQGAGQGGLHQAQEEVQQADVPRFVHADDKRGVRVVAALMGQDGAVADGFQRLVQQVLGVGFAAEAVGIAQDAEARGVAFEKLQVLPGLRPEAFELLRGEFARQDDPRREGLQFALAHACLRRVVHRLGQKRVVDCGLVKRVKQSPRRTHDLRVSDGIGEIKLCRAALHAPKYSK